MLKLISIRPIVVDYNGVQHTIADYHCDVLRDAHSNPNNTGLPGTYVGVHPDLENFLVWMNQPITDDQLQHDEATNIRYFDASSSFDVDDEPLRNITTNKGEYYEATFDPDNCCVLKTDEEFAALELSQAQELFNGYTDRVAMLKEWIDFQAAAKQEATMLALKFASGPIAIGEAGFNLMPTARRSQRSRGNFSTSTLLKIWLHKQGERAEQVFYVNGPYVMFNLKGEPGYHVYHYTDAAFNEVYRNNSFTETEAYIQALS